MSISNTRLSSRVQLTRAGAELTTLAEVINATDSRVRVEVIATKGSKQGTNGMDSPN